MTSNDRLDVTHSWVEGCGMGGERRYDRTPLPVVVLLRLMMVVQFGIVRVMED